MLTTVMTRIVVEKSTCTDHAKPHFDFFFTTTPTSKEMFFSELELKKALRDTLTLAALSGLIDHGKLANQIVGLGAIVVKSEVYSFGKFFNRSSIRDGAYEKDFQASTLLFIVMASLKICFLFILNLQYTNRALQK